MPSERGFLARLPVRVAALAGAIGLAAALFMGRGAPASDLKPPALDGVHFISTAGGPEPLRAAASSPPRSAMPEGARAEIPKEILDAIENGSQAPLTPPVIHVDAELAPGSVLTSAPLVPEVISVDAEPAPGSVPTSAPLVPPIVDAFAAPAGR